MHDYEWDALYYDVLKQAQLAQAEQMMAAAQRSNSEVLSALLGAQFGRN